MSDPCSESNPCNIPAPIGGYDPPFSFGEFLLISGLMALPVVLATLAMAIRASRRVDDLSFKTLLAAWLLPPSLLAGFLLAQEHLSSGAGRVIDFLFRSDGQRELFPLLLSLYIASLIAAWIYYRLRNSRQRSGKLFE